MNPIVYAIPVFMLTILLEAWVARRRGVKVYDIPDAITSLHLGVLSQVTGLFLKVLSVGIYVLIHDRFSLTRLPVDSPLVWLGALIAYDFCYYWLHRMSHEVNVLWAAHVVHHSSEYYNLATALRQTSTGALLGWIFYVPQALAGVPPVVFVGVAMINLLYQYWVHTELVGKLGWYDRVFSSPSNHRVHHGQNDYCIDKNYGGILVIWDRMFGTFAEERSGEKIVFGIRSPLRSFNPIWGNLHYYVELWRKSIAATGLAKLSIWIAPPGGWRQPLPHFDAAQFRYFSTATPTSLRWYVALHYALAVPFITQLLDIAPSLEMPALISYASVIIVTCVSLGAVLEGKRLAIRFEQLRVVVLGVAASLQPTWFEEAVPPLAKAVLLLVMLGSAAWLARAHAR